MQTNVALQYLALVVVMGFSSCDGCQFGMPDVGCAFDCHCAGGATCSPTDGWCPTGCDSTDAGNMVQWGGPGCQIGNIAFNSLASNGPMFMDTADKAVDATMQSCSVSFSLDHEDPAYLRLELGDTYVIENITIYADNTSFVSGSDVQTWVDDMDAYETCGTMDGSSMSMVDDMLMFTMYLSEPRKTRYMRFMSSEQHSYLQVCEVVVQGYLYRACAEEGKYGPGCLLGCDCNNCDTVMLANCPQCAAVCTTTTTTVAATTAQQMTTRETTVVQTSTPRVITDTSTTRETTQVVLTTSATTTEEPTTSSIAATTREFPPQTTSDNASDSFHDAIASTVHSSSHELTTHPITNQPTTHPTATDHHDQDVTMVTTDDHQAVTVDTPDDAIAQSGTGSAASNMKAIYGSVSALFCILVVVCIVVIAVLCKNIEREQAYSKYENSSGITVTMTDGMSIPDSVTVFDSIRSAPAPAVPLRLDTAQYRREDSIVRIQDYISPRQAQGTIYSPYSHYVGRRWVN